MSDDQTRGNDDPHAGEPDPTSPLPPPSEGAGPPSPPRAAEPSGHTPWYRRRGAPTAVAGLVAFLLGVGVGIGGAGPEAADDELVALTADVTDLEEQAEEYEAEIAELEDELSEAGEAAGDVDDLEEQLEETEGELADAERRAETADELDARAADFDEREERLASQLEADSSEAAAEPEPAAESGCSSGQVDVNSAGSAELQRIHQVGPDRAGQIASLRPFSSVDGLTRVSGIGPAHLDAIKGQGLACVP